MIFSSLLTWSSAATLILQVAAVIKNGDRRRASHIGTLLRRSIRGLEMHEFVQNPQSRHDDDPFELSLFVPDSSSPTTSGADSNVGRHDDDAPVNDPSQKVDFTSELPEVRHPDDVPNRDVITDMNMTGVERGSTPSIVPSDLPSLIPTAFPSMSPAPTISHAPSYTPSLSFNSTLPISPTTAPTFSGSFRPTIDCNLSEGGFFGNTSNADSLEAISFAYEVEYRRGANVNDMFAAIEKQVGDTVVPFLFPDDCLAESPVPGNETEISNTTVTNTTDTNTTDTNTTDTNATGTNTTDIRFPNTTDVTTITRGANRYLTRMLKVIGFSPQPTERFMPDLSCQVPVAERINLCNVTEGRFTLFLDAPENGEAATARAAIRASMDKGEFNQIHPSIVRVSFSDVDPTQPQGFPSPSPTLQNRATGTTNSLPVWAYVLIAIGGVILIGLGIFVWRRRRSREEVASVGGSQYGEVQGDLVEDSYQPPRTTTRLSSHDEEDSDDYDQSSSKGGSRGLS